MGGEKSRFYDLIAKVRGRAAKVGSFEFSRANRSFQLGQGKNDAFK